MVDQPPIFLGGQGGIVGPLRLGYGTVTKAGAIIRRDYPGRGCIVGQGQERGEVAPFYPGLYLDVTRRVGNNIFTWQYTRPPHVVSVHPTTIYEGGTLE